MQLTANEEKELIEDFFKESRQILKKYFDERKLVLSNSQLFAFILISPITLAIASDGNLDFTETTMLVDLAAYFDKNILPSEFDKLEQPPNRLSDRDFKKIVYSELRYLCLSMGRFESQLIACIRSLIQMDEQLSHEADPKYSIKMRVVEMMKGVIYNNLGADAIEEAKVQSILKQLNLQG